MTELALVRGEVVDGRLAELADEIRSQDALVVQSAHTMVEHAIHAGQALAKAKAIIGFGGWEQWCQTEFPDRHVKTLRLYMRLAGHAEQVRAASPRSIDAARRLLVGKSMTPTTAQLRNEARHLRAQGMTFREIGARMGVSGSAVQGWLNPVIAERRRQRQRQESRAARRESQRRARERIIKTKGGGVAEAYALVRRALRALEKAGEVEKNSSTRRAISTAMNRLYAAEDLIVVASKGAENRGVA